jgi:septum formation protein
VAATSPFVLASRSPQRRAILTRLGVEFTVRVSGVDELEQGGPGELTVENALRKARAVQDLAKPQETILGCDTVVSLDDQIHGKPGDATQAREMLEALAGRVHEVTSGLALLIEGEERTAIARTEVSFRAMGRRMLDWYLATEEWQDRAGGYAIQGAGAALVRSIQGEYENVVGLPVASLLDIHPRLLAG